jgi:hypothetical protein
MSIMTLTRRIVVIASLAALPALAACGSSEPGHRVATLRSPGTTATAGARASNGTPAVARPRERLDMTPEESDALWETYNRCLSDHGAGPKAGRAPAGRPAAVPGRPVDSKVEAKAEAACLPMKPLPAWQYDRANPESLDFIHKLVRCLRAKGVRYVEEEPAGPGDDQNSISFGGKNNDPGSISKGLNLTPTCEKEVVVGGGRK